MAVKCGGWPGLRISTLHAAVGCGAPLMGCEAEQVQAGEFDDSPQVPEIDSRLCSAISMDSTANSTSFWHDDTSWLQMFGNMKDILRDLVVYKDGVNLPCARPQIYDEMIPSQPKWFSSCGMERPKLTVSATKPGRKSKAGQTAGECWTPTVCPSSSTPHGCSLTSTAKNSPRAADGSERGQGVAIPQAASYPFHSRDLTFGAHTRTGTKLNIPDWQNQDRFLVLPLGPQRALVAVFDGHGLWGHRVASRVREVFLERAPCLVPHAPAFLTDEVARIALVRLFALADEVLSHEVDGSGRPLAEFSGTTTTVALIDVVSSKVAIAHVGDSALMLIAGETIFYRTLDHIVDAEAEQRVLASGGEVQEFTVSGITARRVCMRGKQFPGLAMSRALGDLVARDLGVSSQPEVRVGVPFPPGSQLVVASDGVWETMPAEDAARCISSNRDPQVAALSLVEAARSLWPEEGNIDDITAVVVAAPSVCASAI
mmetsp:Transcript_120559/g.240027  ORF Transcript_120559/g.240027 Transcript_120559/m.240027 type:complete len:485 (-) Transcript_120559:199-1653(-)|eukprot:CAMPEP_0172817662 /NCGR_PEP_ID=MMETSP1075-20121228/13361_1 /TAXON_ID=2916 /ORGANISM="Ceratium fusus, Strain PA161109" /LENGTH=484 /DNA_ID=CAMNT_0013657903 /DNA_START=9 /DNA_END=1463 /DNA_ORIENTATION=-